MNTKEDRDYRKNTEITEVGVIARKPFNEKFKIKASKAMRSRKITELLCDPTVQSSKSKSIKANITLS
jgi:hypothetical protein